jgi:hypothetical protein
MLLSIFGSPQKKYKNIYIQKKSKKIITLKKECQSSQKIARKWFEEIQKYKDGNLILYIFY